MICGILHEGSGLGDQLMRYITVRTLAEKKGFEWDMAHPENFKGASFMKRLQVPGTMPMDPVYKVWNEREVRENGVDVRSYDPEINFVEDWTVLDGSFEDYRYWGDNLVRIVNWLHVDPLPMPRDLCVIGFRGGEYATVPDLFLPKEYWEGAINHMRALGVQDFEVHTDDVVLAKQFFPDFECIHDIALNWRAMRHAKYAIIANSAFYIMPRHLRHFTDPKSLTLAPRYWARHNLKQWARPACWYESFTYL